MWRWLAVVLVLAFAFVLVDTSATWCPRALESSADRYSSDTLLHLRGPGRQGVAESSERPVHTPIRTLPGPAAKENIDESG